MDMSVVLPQVISGLMKGSCLFLVTIGLTLIYGVLSVLNVAHVSFYMLGAYFACIFWQILRAHDFSYFVAIPLTCLAVLGIGLIIELVLMRRLYRRIQGEQLLVTFGLIYIFSDLVKLIWGPEIYKVGKPEILTGSIGRIGEISFPATIAFSLAIAVLIGVSLWLWLQRTKFGNIVRGTQSNPEMMASLGIPVPLVYSLVFSISALLAGLGGAVWMATGIAQLGTLDVPMLPQVFCVMVIGGMGSLLGTAVAAFTIGQVYALSLLIAPKAGMIAIYAVTALVLIIRPWGFFGTRGRVE